ncbi:hypothetical protein MAPG_03054 [Magnaporthiopsis poae ATCC 64411]|uniref:Uncharacterized protein n=1 Tax=Magnaporthiopsis poae (strain ATCC 64411 / 73-15) TaxID=644358 RepID=A0A0C4DT06_MAGP6|nr:hypothetical protein MAPG_03054 [Magnaporthiopsis poae ATCC 64411]
MEPVIEAFVERFPGVVFGPPQFRYLRSMIGNDPKYGAPLLQPGVPGIGGNRRRRRTAPAGEQAPAPPPTAPMEAPAPPPAPMETAASELPPVEAPAQSLTVDDGNLGFFNIGIAGWDLGLPSMASDLGLDLGPGSEEADLEFLGQLMAAASPDGGMGYPTTTSSMDSAMECPAITNSMGGAMPITATLGVADSSLGSTSQLPQSMGASVLELPSLWTAACDGTNCLIPKDYRHTHGADGSVTFEEEASVVGMIRRAIMEVDPAYSGEMTMGNIHGRG